jgi:putative ABC transport system permease protein
LFERAIGRQKEIAVRTALGASGSRLTQLFVTEMFLLSSLAGAVAITVSFWSVRLLRTSISQDWTRWVPGWNGIQVDRTALAFAILLAAAVGILGGIATAIHSSRVHPHSTLKETSRGPMLPGRGRGRLRGGLAIAQIMFAVVLLACAGLTAQGFLHLADVYKSFDPANVLRMEISLPERSYPGDTQIRNFYQPFLRKTRALPEVQFASIVTNTPASNVDNETTPFTIEGRPAVRATEAPSADFVVSSPDYFRVLRIRLLVGREFSEADHDGTAPVVVISKTMAARFWPNGDELNHHLKLGVADSAEPWMTVVGVVDDVRQNWWNPVERAVIYRPFSQAPRRGMAVLVRASANPTNQVPAIRDIVRQQDAEIAVREVSTMKTEITDSIAIVRIMGILMGIFGAVAVALSSVGVYGILAESVARRTPEIGIRLALGAAPHEVMKLILSQALRLTGVGLAIGLPLAFAVNRAMASLIFGIVGIDLGMLAGSAALLTIVALVAGYVPARRAMRVDPMVALRYE